MMKRTLFLALFFAFAVTGIVNAQPKSASKSPVSFFVFDRTRVNVVQWFAAPPQSETYPYVESLLRLGIAQKNRHLDWWLELSQPAVLDLPSDAVSPNLAQGQLGLGGTYYAVNGNETDPAAAFLKQGFLRYHFSGADKNVRLGRFEFIDGAETKQKNSTIGWLQANRIAHRLIGNFAFSDAQRSLDGVDGHYGGHAAGSSWDITAMAARADQGVFNMNGNEELNVDVQYLAFTQNVGTHLLWRAFGVGYHDGRTGILKVDNRPLAVRKADKKNIRLGTYGANVLTEFPAGPGQIDLLGWGVLQNGNWGKQSDHAGAAALEAGYRFGKTMQAPWLRGGWFYGSGDNTPTDNEHSTFFQVLPTPRIYARFPFYNLMNSTDSFVQVIDRPAKRLELRGDLHWLQLTSSNDLWYLGGGAFDNKVFGYVGRPANGHSSFATVGDISADWQTTKNLAINFYYANVRGKSVIGAIYPVDRNAQFGYVEMVYHWGLPQRKAK